MPSSLTLDSTERSAVMCSATAWRSFMPGLAASSKSLLMVRFRATKSGPSIRTDALPDVSVTTTAVHALNEHGAVTRGLVAGATQDGLAKEVIVTALVIVEDGAIRRRELFNEDDVAAVLARFAELTVR